MPIGPASGFIHGLSGAWRLGGLAQIARCHAAKNGRVSICATRHWFRGGWDSDDWAVPFPQIWSYAAIWRELFPPSSDAFCRLRTL